MRKFKLSVKRYADKLEEQLGFADPEMVKRYAEARQKHKHDQIKGSFNPYTQDPNCKTCGKQNNKKGK